MGVGQIQCTAFLIPTQGFLFFSMPQLKCMPHPHPLPTATPPCSTSYANIYDDAEKRGRLWVSHRTPVAVGGAGHKGSPYLLCFPRGLHVSLRVSVSAAGRIMGCLMKLLVGIITFFATFSICFLCVSKANDTLQDTRSYPDPQVHFKSIVGTCKSKD